MEIVILFALVSFSNGINGARRKIFLLCDIRRSSRVPTIQHVKDNGEKSSAIAGDKLHDVIVEVAEFHFMTIVEDDEALNVENDHFLLDLQRHGLIRKLQDAEDKPMNGVGFEGRGHLLDCKVSKQFNTSQFTMDGFWVIAVAEEEEEDRFQLFRTVGFDALDNRLQIVFGRFLENQGVANDERRNTTKAQHSKAVESSKSEGAVVDEAVDEMSLGFAFKCAEDDVKIPPGVAIISYRHSFNEFEATVGSFFWAAEF